MRCAVMRAAPLLFSFHVASMPWPLDVRLRRHQVHAVIDSNAVKPQIAAMPTLTIRNVPEQVHQALRRRAAENARSVEAEVRALLESAATAPASDWRREIADIQ